MSMSGGSSRSLAVVDTDFVQTLPKKKKASLKKSPVLAEKKQKATPKASAEVSVTKINIKRKATKSTKSETKESKKTTHKRSVLDSKKSFNTLKRDPLGHLLIEKKLRENGFRGDVSTDKADLDRYSTDESIFSIRPQIILKPKNTRDIEIAVSVFGAETGTFPALSLTARAAGTGLSGGSLTDSAVIDVSVYMQKIDTVKNKKDTITVTCEPGAAFCSVEAALKKHGAYLPFAPASKDICAIGGAIANNAAGPDSLKYGHAADWIESLDVVFHDGKTYTVKPITYKEYQSLIKKDTAHARIAREVFELIEKSEKIIADAKPHTPKNTAGYALWDVLSTSVASFKKGKGTFDLTQLIAGSQGTIGIVASLTMRAQVIDTAAKLIMVPVFDLASAGKTILAALQYNPINIEIFDALTFDLALKNPQFFRNRLSGLQYYKVMYALYTTYHVRLRRKTPAFTLLVTLDETTYSAHGKDAIVSELKSAGCATVRFVDSLDEREMWWQVRRASYTLSKLQDKNKRPAAFLEDMTVPPEQIPRFFSDIEKLLKKYDVVAAVHGHGGNGHFHFYPLIDFENEKTPELIEDMSEEFFKTAVRYGGSICGEHNDGIIRTPHLSKMFDKKTLTLFENVEHIFDPKDIFNPGKKVNPRFDVKDSIRKTN